MRRFLTLAGVGALVGSTASAQITDPIPTPIPKGSIAIGLQPVATGLAAAVDATTAGDATDRLFVVDQAGQIRLIKNGVLEPVPVLDVAGRLVTLGVLGSHDENDFDERGLLSLAFHPGFADPKSAGFRKFYTFTSEPVSTTPDFTTSSPPPVGRVFDCQSVISEWRMDPNSPDIADPASRRELFRFDKPQFNHNAGQLAFGPDGFLYISTGDGGGANDADGVDFFGPPTFGHGPDGNGQNTLTIYGKMLRIDPLGTDSYNGQYGLPADNPFDGTNGLREIYAYGLRNPFRFSFDAPSGRLIAGDVGQNFIEEIDIVTNGGNYGWRLKEGTFKFFAEGPLAGAVSDDLTGLPSGLIDPVAQYDHDEGIAIIGGFVYRGSVIPDLQGKYVFGDFSTAFFAPLGRLFYADLDTGLIQEFRLGLDDHPLGMFLKGFGRDASGELYVLAGTNLGPAGTQAGVFRITPPPCLGDANGDRVIDMADVTSVLANWVTAGPAGDADHNGAVNYADVTAVFTNWSSSCS